MKFLLSFLLLGSILHASEKSFSGHPCNDVPSVGFAYHCYGNGPFSRDYAIYSFAGGCITPQCVLMQRSSIQQQSRLFVGLSAAQSNREDVTDGEEDSSRESSITSSEADIDLKARRDFYNRLHCLEQKVRLLDEGSYASQRGEYNSLLTFFNAGIDLGSGKDTAEHCLKEIGKTLDRK